MGYVRDPPAKDRALARMAERDAVEAEMAGLIAALTAPGAPGLSGNLVDAEGFPRDDVNIHEVRTQRNRLACLRTDHARATADIEALLQQALAPGGGDGGGGDGAGAARESAPEPAPTPVSTREVVAEVPRVPVTRTPFAYVDNVAAGGPAEEAGLKVGDRVVVFGAVSLRTMPNADAAMTALPMLLREHEEREVTVAVSRAVEGSEEREMKEMQLTPRRWAGAGLLGCHVVVAAVEEDARYAPEVTVAVATSHME